LREGGCAREQGRPGRGDGLGFRDLAGIIHKFEGEAR
jgi:hypothetical protein